MSGGDGQGTEANQVANGAVNLDAVLRDAGDTTIELRVLGVAEKDDGANTGLESGGELGNSTGSNCSSLAVGWKQCVSNQVFGCGIEDQLPVSTDGDLGRGTPGRHIRDQSCHLVDGIGAASSGQEVAGQVGGVLDTLESKIVGVFRLKTALERGAERSL